MPQTLTNLLTHIIFSTKNRTPCITEEFRPRFFAYIGGIVRRLGGRALAVNGTADHVHLLLSLRPAVSISKALLTVKANSSRWIHGTWPARRTFGWQAGYGAFSVSQSHAAAVMEYIANQEEHHRRVTFQQELLVFLKKNHVAYNDRYIWE